MSTWKKRSIAFLVLFSKIRANKRQNGVYILLSKYSYARVVAQLFHISINLLAFYHECRSLIGYATHYLFKQ